MAWEGGGYNTCDCATPPHGGIPTPEACDRRTLGSGDRPLRFGEYHMSRAKTLVIVGIISLDGAHDFAIVEGILRSCPWWKDALKWDGRAAITTINSYVDITFLQCEHSVFFHFLMLSPHLPRAATTRLPASALPAIPVSPVYPTFQTVDAWLYTLHAFVVYPGHAVGDIPILA